MKFRFPGRRIVGMIGIVVLLSLSIPPVRADAVMGSTSFTCSSVTFSFSNDSNPASWDFAQVRVINVDTGGTIFDSWSDVGPYGDASPYTVHFATQPDGSTLRLEVQIDIRIISATGTCAASDPTPVVAPGCDVELPIAPTSVVGRFQSTTAAYWTPGKLTSPLVTLPAGQSAWVLGLDQTGAYYKIIWVCDLLWVPVETMGPAYGDPVWQGRALPEIVVD